MPTPSVPSAASARPVPLRLQRTAALSAVVLGLAAAAHGSAHGALPDLGDFLLLVAFVGLPAWFMTARRVSAGALLLFVVGGQWALHTAFGAMAQGMSTGGTAHQMGTAAAPIGEAHELSVSMAAAHTVAAVLVALWLATGERLVFVLLDAISVRPRRALRPVLVPASGARPLPARDASSVPVLRRRLVGVALSWRGPPVSACFR